MIDVLEILSLSCFNTALFLFKQEHFRKVIEILVHNLFIYLFICTARNIPLLGLGLFLHVEG